MPGPLRVIAAARLLRISELSRAILGACALLALLVPSSNAADSWSHQDLLREFIGQFSPLSLPASCCQPTQAQSIDQRFAALYPARERNLWVRDALGWPEQIEDFKYGYLLYDHAPVTVLIVQAEQQDSQNQYNLYELWSFHSQKGLVQRLELAGQAFSFSAMGGASDEYHLSTQITPGLKITTRLAHKFEPGVMVPEGVEASDTETLFKYKLDPKTGLIKEL